jgi:RHS repeat-associated protein
MSRTTRVRTFMGWIPRLGVLLMAIAAATPSLGAVGRTPGTASVTRDGKASYVIPIRPIPGAAGLAPELAIAYGSEEARGILGVGFSIAGLSAIVPCPRTIAQDGAAAPITLTTADRYCLDGQRLRLVSGMYGANSARYRTEIDEALRVTSYGVSGKQPTWFKVERANGLVYEYGNSIDSRARSSTSSNAVTFIWALNRIVDRSGNTISFVYENDPAVARFRPAHIDYTGTTSGGTAEYRIDFVYQTALRDDVVEQSTPSASEIATLGEDRLLARLELQRLGTVYRQYLFTYQTPTGNNSRLSSVRECSSSSSDCLLPTVFTWQAATSGYGTPVPTAAPVAAPVLTFDLNGDGYDDVVWPQSGTWHLLLGSAVGYGAAKNTGIAATSPALARPLEWNADGRMDLLIAWSDGTWRVLRGTATGFASPVAPGPVAVSSTTESSSWTVADLDGDGRDDLVRASNLQRAIFVRLNSPAGLQSELNCTPSGAFEPALLAFRGQGRGRSAHRRIDFDGDGREDLLVQGCVPDPATGKCAMGGGWWAALSNGGALQQPVRLYRSQSGRVPMVGDFNADRLTDVAYARSDATIGLVLSRGRAGFTAVDGPSSGDLDASELRVADFDGDRYDDVLVAGSSAAGATWRVFRGTGTGLATIATITSVPVAGAIVTDANGDSLPDLAAPALATGLWTLYPRNGLPGDLLASATDGYGVKATWMRSAMSSAAVYTRGTGAVYPSMDSGGSRPVVRTLTQTDGTGGAGAYTLTYSYAKARRDLAGRGDLGFGSRVVVDDRLGHDLRTTESYLQTFPHVGRVSSLVQRAGGGNVFAQEIAWSATRAGTAQLDERFTPYASMTSSKEHAVGGPSSGTVFRVVETRVDAIDATSGLVIDRTTTTIESATGLATGATRTERVLHSDVVNDSVSWCVGRPQHTEVTIAHSGSSGTALTRSYAQEWDAAKCRVVRRQLQPDDARLQLTIAYTYDGFGNVASEALTTSGSSPRVTSIAWGGRGQFPESVTNALGHKTTIAWDPARGVPISLRDPNTLLTSWTYDTFGRRTGETRPNQTSTVWTWSGCGASCDSRAKFQVMRADRSSAAATFRNSRVEYDRDERPILLASDLPGGGDSITTLEFDARGQLRSAHLPYPQGGVKSGEWRYEYDALGRPTRRELRAPDGRVDRVSQIAYDGLRTIFTDPLGHESERITNAWGDTVRVVDALNRATNYEYDAARQLVRVVESTGAQVLAVAYNARGMVTSQTDADLGSWVYDVNGFGEILRIRDARTASPNWTTTLSYDALSRLTARTDVAENVTGTFAYGTSAASRNIGRLISVSASDGSYVESLTYDSAGRLSRRRVETDAVYDFDLTYSDQGLLATLRYPASTSGYRLTLGYEYTNGLLTRIVNPAPSPDTELWRLNAMDASGRILDETLGASVQVISDYDALTGRLRTRTTGTGGTTALQDLAYTWDANDNLTRRSDLNQSNLTEQFTYDALGRLIRGHRNGTKNLEVTYSETGNISTKFEEGLGARSYTYHAAKRHAAVAAGDDDYGYDANGNMTLRNGAPTSWYSYNLPKLIKQAGGNSSQFFHSPARERWKQVAVSAGETETTIYVGGLFEKVSRNGVTSYRHRIEAPGGTAAIYLRRTGGSPAVATYYVTRDHLGSTDKLIHAAGAAVAVRESFTGFGRRRGAAWSGSPSAADLTAIENISRSGFTGHEMLDHLNLVHMNGRIYDPVAARFLSPDPIVQAPYDPQNLNRYSYVLNRPLSLVDPTGFSAADGDGGGAADLSWSDWAPFHRDDKGPRGNSRGRNPPLENGVVPDGVASGDYRPPTEALFSGLLESSDPADPLSDVNWRGLLSDWWPGYALGTCIYNNWVGEACAAGATLMAIVGVIPSSGGPGKAVAVIGRQADTLIAKDWAGHIVLDLPDWTLAKNDAWIKSLIEGRVTVYLASAPTARNVFDEIAGRSTVFGRELQQLLSAGYRRVGDHLVPPP